jgi:hypothetical protein
MRSHLSFIIDRFLAWNLQQLLGPPPATGSVGFADPLRMADALNHDRRAILCGGGEIATATAARLERFEATHVIERVEPTSS